MIWEPYIEDGQYPFTSVLRHFKNHKVKVPEIVKAFPELGLVLLEDLGDLTLERKFWENQDQNLALPFYYQALDELIKIHYPSTEDKTDCTAFKMAFDHSKLLWEMNYGKEHLIEKFCEMTLKPVELKLLEDTFNKVCQILADEPRRICHRDYHSRNLMLKLGETRVIDFQDARLGPIQYDLVSLLHDSYVNLNAESISECLKYYKNQAKDFTRQNLETEHFDYIFKIQMIQRCFKACGSFASFFNQRKDVRYLKYLPGTIRKVHSSLMGLDEYTGFRTFIEDAGLLDKDYNITTS